MLSSWRTHSCRQFIGRRVRQEARDFRSLISCAVMSTLPKYRNNGHLVATPTSAWTDYRRLKPFLRPYASRLILILSTSMIATLLGLAQPFISKLLIDSALLKKDWRM